MSDLAAFIEQSRRRVDKVLEHWLDASETIAPRLLEAMRYSIFNGGKRVRPILAYASAQAVGHINTITDSTAAAVECIHAYSLIHDDLPAMDDDDLRRGKPTCHVAFDEATAILAGDALQTLAFERLAQSATKQPDVVLSLVSKLATAAGDKGMVAGQMIDLLAEGQSDRISLTSLERIHRHKTGALISSAVSMGGISAGASPEQMNHLGAYADAIGLAFQVQDDIIDVTSDTETLGKQQGADVQMDKSTYVSLLGLEGARDKAQMLLSSALDNLATFDEGAEQLRSIARYIVERNH